MMVGIYESNRRYEPISDRTVTCGGISQRSRISHVKASKAVMSSRGLLSSAVSTEAI